MNIPEQIENISIARTTNAAHYKYLQTVIRRAEATCTPIFPTTSSAGGDQ